MSAVIARNSEIQRREMSTLPLKSLPLGFRFHPKDEELVNHYLKGKIDGRIRSEIEVIPEVDVCKCEPWDLPDKSLIRSDDPEWFFFAAKDRKYPKGHRSNRATKAGYWKATGKDRTIRSRSSIVGMKKTLVFHRGRAPKGVRTCWIMHEYRTTEPEDESSEQGGYVLYRLFKKPDDKSLNSNFDVVEANGFSPAPSRSSPDDTHHDADVLDVTPMNQVSPESDFLDPKTLLNSVKMHPADIERWLDDVSDCSTSNSVKPEGSSCNGIMDSAAGCHEAELGLAFDNILGMLEQSPGPQFEPKGSDVFRYHDYPSSGNFNLGPQMGPPLDDDDVQRDSLDEFLSSVFSNQEEFCSGGSMTQKDLITEMLPEDGGFTAQPTFWDSPSGIESMRGSDLEMDTGVAQGAGDLTCSSPTSIDQYPEMAQYLINHDEWANLLPYESVGPDVYSLGSNTISLQGMFCSMDEPANGKNSASNEDGVEETGVKIRVSLQGMLCSMDEPANEKNSASNEDGVEETGIQIRARKPQGPASSSNLLPQQGQVLMRNRLQRKLEGGPFSIWNTNQEDKVATPEEGEHKSAGGEDLGPDLVYMLEDLSIHDDLDSTVLPEKSNETKPALRSRKTVAGDSGHDNKAFVLNKNRRKWVLSWPVLLAVILMLLLLLVGLCNRKSFQ